MTKDERFLLELYLLKLSGVDSIDPYELGKKLSYSERQTKNIINWLAQANFIKKIENEITITPHGETLAIKIKS